MKTRDWIELDRAHGWHPFTDQAEWEGGEPLVIERGEGVWLFDSEGGRYLDGNSSIWTNLHGHAHPRINEAMEVQMGKISHSSYLGFANPRASELAGRLCGFFPEGILERCFFSDDGSTALEVALRMALQYFGQNGEGERREVVAFREAYHGDTLGAASVGGVGRISHRGGSGYPVRRVGAVEDLEGFEEPERVAAVVVEPVVQGVNEIRIWPEGMLRKLRDWCDENGVFLIFDEVMTGFGRTGQMFGCQHERVWPDFLCLAKGLSGGYLPLAATLTTGRVYEGFKGAGRGFSYGHSFTGNQLGCAAALASLDVFVEERVMEGLGRKVEVFREVLEEVKSSDPEVYEVRQVGLVAGIEYRRTDGEFFAQRGAKGREICARLRERGVLTRPILDTVVLMPPLAISEEELRWLGEVFCSEESLMLDEKKEGNGV